MFIENTTQYLNNDTKEKPSLPFPVTGSKFEAAAKSLKYGCTHPHLNKHHGKIQQIVRNNQKIRDYLYNCLVKKINLKNMKLPILSVDKRMIETRMQVASHWNILSKSRYTLIPAAAGTYNGTIKVAHSTPESIFRGMFEKPNNKQYYSSFVMDFVSWLQLHFKESDYIFLKMDIEGGEYDLIPEMVRSGAMKLIDKFAWECHHNAKSNLNCKELKRMTIQCAPNIEWFEEGKDYDFE